MCPTDKNLLLQSKELETVYEKFETTKMHIYWPKINNAITPCYNDTIYKLCLVLTDSSPTDTKT